MGMNAILPAILFLAGIGAILVSGGATIYMTVGDVLVALAGLAFVKFTG